MEYLVRGVGCVLVKGLELLQRVMPAESKAGGALEGSVLLESESVDAMPGKTASMRWAGTVLVLTIFMKVATCTRSAMYTINMMALTRRICHRRVV